MARCTCGSNSVCLSADPSNIAVYDSEGCLLVAPPAGDAVFGSQFMGADFDLVGRSDNVWHDTGLTVTLPAAGTYEVVADASVQLNVEFSVTGTPASVPMYRTFIRLFNVTANAGVTGSSRIMAGVGSMVTARVFDAADGTARAFVTVASPTVIRLETQLASNVPAGSTLTKLTITALRQGNTSMYFKRIN